MTTTNVFNTTDQAYTDPTSGALIEGRKWNEIEHTDYVDRLTKLDVLVLDDEDASESQGNTQGPSAGTGDNSTEKE